MVQTFLRDGFLHPTGAAAEPIARECERRLWTETGYDPTTWTEATRWVLYRDDEPFVEAVNSAVLTHAYDTLVGPGHRRRRDHAGAFPLRFPSQEQPVESGWHIDAGSADRELTDDDVEDIEAMGKVEFRVNINSRGRALLLLMLFSDVGPDDSPTRIRVGSHLDVPRVLAPYGLDGVGCNSAFVAAVDRASSSRPTTQAAGRCGDVYVCHPFLVHAAQVHREPVTASWRRTRSNPSMSSTPGRQTAHSRPSSRRSASVSRRRTPTDGGRNAVALAGRAGLREGGAPSRRADLREAGSRIRHDVLVTCRLP
jgi:hypothetical protein